MKFRRSKFGRPRKAFQGKRHTFLAAISPTCALPLNSSFIPCIGMEGFGNPSLKEGGADQDGEAAISEYLQKVTITPALTATASAISFKDKVSIKYYLI